MTWGILKSSKYCKKSNNKQANEKNNKTGTVKNLIEKKTIVNVVSLKENHLQQIVYFRLTNGDDYSNVSKQF